MLVEEPVNDFLVVTCRKPFAHVFQQFVFGDGCLRNAVSGLCCHNYILTFAHDYPLFRSCVKMINHPCTPTSMRTGTKKSEHRSARFSPRSLCFRNELFTGFRKRYSVYLNIVTKGILNGTNGRQYLLHNHKPVLVVGVLCRYLVSLCQRCNHRHRSVKVFEGSLSIAEDEFAIVASNGEPHLGVGVIDKSVEEIQADSEHKQVNALLYLNDFYFVFHCSFLLARDFLAYDYILTFSYSYTLFD